MIAAEVQPGDTLDVYGSGPCTVVTTEPFRYVGAIDQPGVRLVLRPCGAGSSVRLNVLSNTNLKVITS